MKAIIKGFSTLILAIVMLGVFSSTSYAKQICTTQYGGGETCINIADNPDLEIDKTIYNPKSGEYESDIKSSGGSYPYIFESSDKIKFRITVKNVGDIEIKDINAYDALPAFLVYDSGDGDDRKDGKEVKFEIGDLKPDEKKSFTFKAKIENDGISPKSDKICLSNFVTAKGKRADDLKKSEDTADSANFCITLGKVLGTSKAKIAKLPTTGGENVFALGLSIGLVLVGYGIKKLSD
ncbi:hypothetical protein CO058_03570 [candidate division WWE3 bacterium CG_4_9_14_0_2_um_filter_35_11]|uniref:DUF11 domain-containing protein n=1 Tax=candidate division WWE3 bacterium CG_4_9_14_0_2_um_filter_35_11 TaxID=1975077 RepID=A0A2M8EKW6_UNCKA|nr:MAG: hypothetical protein COV25_02295 [candidate division WWE3 bacterium CG10_big_fil_rev_8_21_14_0_10_35_32]PJC23381.1 MAG: hypothetical protein CO058_03570 [candidate division WWE3 bacterium CG_4_9_14_0_2_um_filter_35_11]